MLQKDKEAAFRALHEHEVVFIIPKSLGRGSASEAPCRGPLSARSCERLAR